MSLTRAQRTRLPRSAVVSVWWGTTRIATRLPLFAKFRLANAVMVRIGRLYVSWRMPWLEGSARALHPHLFPAPEELATRSQHGGGR